MGVIFDSPLGRNGFGVGYGQQGTGLDHPSALAGSNDKLGFENVIDQVGSEIRFDFDSPAMDKNSMGSATPLNLEAARVLISLVF